MNESDKSSCADRLLFAYDQATCVEPPSQRYHGLNMEQAYDVARIIHALRIVRGETLVGRKIGFTNRNIWAQYGVDSPIWAPVYARTMHRADQGTITHSLTGTVSPRIEPEICFGLRAGIASGTEDIAAVLQSIAWVAAAFEIVDCHYPGWKFQGPDSVADQAFHSALVVGRPCPIEHLPIPHWVDALREAEVTLTCNDAEQDRGRGANALGHPATAMAFLVRMLARYPGFPALAPGEVVTTGTLTAAWPIVAGQRWTMRFGGLPLEPLEARFA